MFIQSRIFVAAIAFTVLAVFVDAAAYERRQLIDSLIGQVTSSIASEASTAFDAFTSEAAADINNIFTEVTQIGGQVYSIVSSEGAQAVTLAQNGAGILTSAGGSVFTAATGKAGSAINSVASSASTAAIGQLTNTSNSASSFSPNSFILATPVLTGLVTMVAGLFFGAYALV